MALQSPLRMHRSGRALTEDAEGPRMSMAMRRQLGMAPNKSPSKAGSAAARESWSFTLSTPPLVMRMRYRVSDVIILIVHRQTCCSARLLHKPHASPSIVAWTSTCRVEH